MVNQRKIVLFIPKNHGKPEKNSIIYSKNFGKPTKNSIIYYKNNGLRISIIYPKNNGLRVSNIYPKNNGLCISIIHPKNLSKPEKNSNIYPKIMVNQKKIVLFISIIYSKNITIN